MNLEAPERRRKIVFPFAYSKDKKLVQVVAVLRERPGALAEVLNALGKKVNLVGTTSYRTGTARGVFSGVGELLSEEDRAKDIEALLEPLPGVVSLQVWESRDGLLVDRFHTGIETIMGEPYIMFPTSGLAQTFDKLVKTFGTGGETILFLEGKHFGLARFELFRGILGPDPISRVGEAAHIFEALGYGTGSVEVTKGGKVKLIRTDCFECAGQVKDGHSCAFTRGLIAGIFESMFGHPMEVEEVACRIKGEKACEFVAIPR